MCSIYVLMFLLSEPITKIHSLVLYFHGKLQIKFVGGRM
jgi:hypothetical protein